MTAPGNIPAHKLAGAAGVLALHVLIAVFLLHAIHVARPVEAAHEVILALTPPPLPPQRAGPAIAPMIRAPTPVLRLPPMDAVAVPHYADPDSQAMQGLGRALFGCRPEAIAGLAPEQRALCERYGMKPKDTLDFADHTNRSRDAALWARDRARKNAPLLLPCASKAGIGVGIATLACLGDGLLNGFDPRKQESYGDAPEQPSHLPNNGDPHPEYTDPDH